MSLSISRRIIAWDGHKVYARKYLSSQGTVPSFSALPSRRHLCAMQAKPVVHKPGVSIRHKVSPLAKMTASRRQQVARALCGFGAGCVYCSRTACNSNCHRQRHIRRSRGHASGTEDRQQHACSRPDPLSDVVDENSG